MPGLGSPLNTALTPQVYNWVLSFEPELLDSSNGQMVPTENIFWARDDIVSSKLDPKEGYSASSWVKPLCGFNYISSTQ
eukprot:2937816-Pyramimonas_sp.AAC.1